MIEIYSKVNPDVLLHIVVRKEDFEPGRKDVVNNNEFLQCALLNMEKGKTFQPHKHIWKQGPRKVIAQESWVCFSGKVRCILYDLNDKVIAEPILKAGDMSMTFEGAHTYEILEDNTMVAEFKTGPYHGQLKDKEFIQTGGIVHDQGRNYHV
jgi:cupin fold WbuC family metalloprotein